MGFVTNRMAPVIAGWLAVPLYTVSVCVHGDVPSNSFPVAISSGYWLSRIPATL